MNRALRSWIGLAFLLLQCTNWVYGQRLGAYQASIEAPASQASLAIPLPVVRDFSRKTARQGVVTVRSDFGGQYQFGAKGKNKDFQLKVSFALEGKKAGAAPVALGTYAFTIDNDKPEGLVFRNLKEFSDDARPGGYAFDEVAMTRISVTDLRTGGSLAEARTRLTLHLSYDIAYGLDVQGMGGQIGTTATAPNPAVVTPKVLKFTWTPDRSYPNYEFQLLRLYNTGPAAADEKIINARVDWSKAVSLETESNVSSLQLTIGEGTGYYAWRVRPIGTYHGGRADSRDWGHWNAGTPAQGATLGLSPGSTPAGTFFFNETEANVNWIYSRTFTEENRVSESMTYANGLHQGRQTQTYQPSQNSTLTTQTVLDHMGRPALRTLPAPQPGPLSGYKQNFVQTPGGQLYTAGQFDANNNFRSPEQVRQDGGQFQYYSNVGVKPAGVDQYVPSAEGYPFTRTLYYNDGTGRVKEESGVGRTHMIGDQAQGMGRTVRTLYATPSEDELVALFGKEAPHHESVQKTITVDQNNTATVTYTSKEGNVIATAVTFMEQDNTDLLEPLGETEATRMPVKDQITKNVKTSEGFVSSKRLAFLEKTTLDLSYSIECKKLEGMCVDINLECGYKVTVIIHNVDDPGKDIVYEQNLSLKKEECTTATVNGITGQYRTVDFTTTPVELAPGTYVIEKKLTVSNDAKASVEKSQEKIDAQIKPLTDWISGSLKSVNCDQELLIFYKELIELANAVNSHALTENFELVCDGCPGRTVQLGDDFIEIYNDPNLRGQYKLSVFGENDKGQLVAIDKSGSGSLPVAVYVQTPCCNLKLDVRYTPPFQCPEEAEVKSGGKDKNGNGSIDVNPYYLSDGSKTEYFPDYEGYAIANLQECGWSLAEAKTIFYAHTRGWKEGDFNKMVHNMLTDKYTVDGTGVNAPAGTTAGTGGTTSSTTPADPCAPSTNGAKIAGTQYSCTELSGCWTNLVLILKDTYCPNAMLQLDQLGRNNGVSNEFDDNNQEDKSAHDKGFDDNFKGGFKLIKWLIKGKLSKRMRDMQAGVGGQGPVIAPPAYSFHLVQEFLNCTGYKFADILEPKKGDNDLAYPAASGDNASIMGELGDFNKPNPKYNPLVQYPGWDNAIAEVKFNGAKLTTQELVEETVASPKRIKDLFPNIKHPLYAFKYFEYADGQFPDLELSVCYRDPNTCKDVNGNPVPCCFDERNNPVPCHFCGEGTVTCPYTHEKWNAGQRFTFYSLIKSYRQPPENWTDQEEIDCNWMSLARSWYRNPGTNPEFTLDYVSFEQFQKYFGRTPLVHESVNFASLEKDAAGNPVMKTAISFVERAGVQMRQECVSGCEGRKGEFRAAVRKMFEDRCYQIGGCKQSSDDNIVPEEDIEAIVERMVAQCQSQCAITTYTCKDVDCRLFNTSILTPGYNSRLSNLQLGVGGRVNASGQVVAGDCPPGTTAMQDCTEMLPGPNFSYSEYTKWLQATEWLADLDILSKCNEQGTYAGEGVPYTPHVLNAQTGQWQVQHHDVYNPQTRKWESRPFSALNCPANGDTFVPRDQYVVPTIQPPADADRLKTGDPVKSPKIGIKVTRQ